VGLQSPEALGPANDPSGRVRGVWLARGWVQGRMVHQMDALHAPIARLEIAHRDGDRVAVAEAECRTKMNLTDQLDLVGGASGLIGLKGEAGNASRS
jgi:hypothetical protein